MNTQAQIRTGKDNVKKTRDWNADQEIRRVNFTFLMRTVVMLSMPQYLDNSYIKALYQDTRSRLGAGDRMIYTPRDDINLSTVKDFYLLFIP